MFGLICSPIASLTKEANLSSERIDEVLYGTKVEILSEKDYFYKVKTMYHYEGYLKKIDVCIMKEKISHLDFLNGIIIKHFVDVLEQPHDISSIIITLPRGAYLRILQPTDNHFYTVELINHQKGYIKQDGFKYRQKLSLQENQELIRKNLVSNALYYLDTQYRWAGKTTYGIDCSGLCQMSYLLEELIIYRDSDFNDYILEKYHLRKIPIEALNLGDLIYMKGHIMMYNGNHQYIHSSSSKGGVIINSLNLEAKHYDEKIAKQIIGCATIF